MWILDNQLARRNINSMTRKDLIGRRYTEEKKAVGENQYTSNSLNRGGSNFPPIKTAQKIGEQVGMSDRGVKDAEKFSQAIDTVTANTGISRATILSKKINCTQDDIIDLAKLEKVMQVEVISQVTSKGLDVGTAIRIAEREEHHRQAAEAEEKRLQLEEQARKEREEKLQAEREKLKQEREEKERLRIEHEAKVKQENERLAKEK